MWGRQLAHLDLATTAGPSFKPLPVLVLAPLSVLGGATPVVWMGLMRAAAVLSLVLAYRVGARLAGPLAGAVAALSLALSADLYRTALLGSAEPVLIALTLGAVDRHMAGRRDWALVLVALAGLIRPEAWVLLGLYGVYVWLHEPGLRPLAVAAVVLPPVLWLGLDWIGSGDPLHGSSTATSATEGSAANASVPAFEVVRRAADAIILPTLVLAGVGIVAAARRRDRAALSLAALALGWIAVVAIMAEVGFTGTRRYLAAPAAALCVLAGVGFASLLDAVRRAPHAPRRGRRDRRSSRSCPRSCAPARTGACSASRAARRISATSCAARWPGPAAARRSCAAGGRRSTPGCRRPSRGSSTCRCRACRRRGRRRSATPIGRRRRSCSAPRRGSPARVRRCRRASTADTVARSGRWRVLRAGA